MIIHSYLAFASHGAAARLSLELAALEGCEVFPAENQDVLVLVTETSDPASQKQLEKQLEEISGLGCLAMVGGWTE